jgi:predicted alpha/beta-fold hydrolase
VTIELCERGGHVGFCAAGPQLRPRWWLEERIPQFLLDHAGA